jgi:DNA-binding MarR family transcriptional regulator
MDFFDALVRYETSLWNHLDRRLGHAGAVSLATLTAVRVVDRYRGTCRVQELRADLGITVGAASKLVDRLERDGLALRRANPDDGRSSLIDLTPTGAEALADGVEALEDALDHQLGNEPDLMSVTDFLVRVDAKLHALTAEVAR